MDCSLILSKSHLRCSTIRSLVACIPFLLSPSFDSLLAQEPQGDSQEIEIYDNEPSQVPRMEPQDAVKGWKLPDGFSVSLYAEEPHVQQPISMSWDARGRLWIVENYTYAESQRNFDTRLRDRVLVFTDSNGDGRFDERKVFWDKGSKLTSIEVGNGGVWLLGAPYLLFIPDANGDDVPDSDPIKVLDGFDDDRVRHNLVNGLRWGPDGWLYGRHGILANSYVGKPGTPQENRVALNTSVWRFHPKSEKFEVYTHGTTNPWGMDWNDHGELFFINTVIGHLWHAVPGAHVERMYGEDLNPYVFRLMPQNADHVHWNEANEKWADIRKIGVSPETDQAGGGHAHCGLMFYLGGSWPADYRDEIFTLNLHGRRINRDHLERKGASYVGLHRPDTANSPDPWFRGIDLTYGPDGSVYILDWSDAGECHENDGVHRHSGRIFRLSYGNPSAEQTSRDLKMLQQSNLATLIEHPNEWFVRQARQTIASRYANGDQQPETKRDLLGYLQDKKQPPRIRLRALWALNALDALSLDLLQETMQDDNEALSSWGVRLVTDYAKSNPGATQQALKLLIDCAKNSRSSLVKLYLASSLQSVDGEEWWQLASILLSEPDLASDRYYPLQVWYGIESHVGQSPDKAIELLKTCKLPEVSTFIVRRVTLGVDQWAEPLDQMLSWSAVQPDLSQLSNSIVQGLIDGTAGRADAPQLKHWPPFLEALSKSKDDNLKQQAMQLNILFNKGRGEEELLAMVNDTSKQLAWRRQAISALARQKSSKLREQLIKAIDERDMAPSAIDALGIVGTPEDSEMLVAKFSGFNQPAREAVVRLLASRPSSAPLLLNAVSENKFPRSLIQTTTLRQLQYLGNEDINKRLIELFPEAAQVNEDKRKRIVDLQEQLSKTDEPAGSPTAGRKLFDQSCAKCHRLFGEGSQIGPELTGSQRSNLNYLLDNIVDPSAQLADTYRMSVIRLEDGRVIMGVVLQQNEKVLTLQTADERLALSVADIEEIQRTNKSLMPEGLLDSLTQQQIRDLVSYLQSSRQVALPHQQE